MYYTKSILRSMARATLLAILASGVSAAEEQETRIYWTGSSEGTISRAALDGSSAEELLAGLANPWGLALDASHGRMYWTERSFDDPQGSRRIRRAFLSGLGREDLVDTSPIQPFSIALDVGAGRMYWSEVDHMGTGLNAIRRANLDGTDVEQLLATGLWWPRAIALDLSSGKLYWAEETLSDARIRRCNLDGSGVEHVMAAEGSQFGGIALHVGAGEIYWGERNVVRRANMNGTNVETIATNGMLAVYGVILDLDSAPAKVYWGLSSGQIKRANLDGSNVEDVAAGSGIPGRIALGRTPEAVPTVSIWGLVVVGLSLLVGQKVKFSRRHAGRA